jgi:hypothetical protein
LSCPGSLHHFKDLIRPLRSAAIFSIFIKVSFTSSDLRKLSSTDTINKVSISESDPLAKYRNCLNSLFVFLAAPSEMFVGTETEAF